MQQSTTTPKLKEPTSEIKRRRLALGTGKARSLVALLLADASRDSRAYVKCYNVERGAE